MSNLPEWMNAEKWDEWVQYRKEIRKTLKPITIKKQMLFLSKYKEQHEEILETSMMNGWQGLFAPKQQKTFNQNNQSNQIIDDFFNDRDAEVIDAN